MVWLLLQDPTRRIVVISAEQSLATRMAAHIRRVIESDAGAARLIPERGGPGRGDWAAGRLRVAGALPGRDPSVLARGLEGNITGARADVLICDDVEVPNTVATPGRRAALRERLRELDFVRLPGAVTLHIGTPHHAESIYAPGGEGPRQGEAFASKGLNGEGARGEGAEGAEGAEGEGPGAAAGAAWTRLVVPALDGHGRPVGRETHGHEALAEMRRLVGERDFSAQMLLRPPQAAEIYPFHPARLRGRYYDEELSEYSAQGQNVLLLGGTRRMARAACHWDPALGPSLDGPPDELGAAGLAAGFAAGSVSGGAFAGPESAFAGAGRTSTTSTTRRRDRNVIALLLRGQAERPGAPAAIYLHRLFYIGPPPAGAAVSGLEWMTAQVADFMEAHCVPEITVEANGVGGFLPGQLGAVLATRGQGLRALPHITKDKKEERIASVFAGLFSSPNFFVHASVRATPFLAELAAWRPGGSALRDDGMDAVAIAFRDYLPGDAPPGPGGLPRPPRYAWQTAAYPGTGTFNAGPALP